MVVVKSPGPVRRARGQQDATMSQDAGEPIRSAPQVNHTNIRAKDGIPRGVERGTRQKEMQQVLCVVPTGRERDRRG